MSFIKLDRKLLTWEWKDDPNMVALWIEILLQANYAESRWHGNVYEKGSFPTSIDKLSRATGLTANQVRTCLKKLKSTNEITSKSTSHGTKIIVNKWAEYQCSDADDNEPNHKPHHNQITNKSQHLKKYKKERKEELLPVYDPSLNEEMSKEQEEELLELMKGRA